jgi:hypothetical protein
VKAFEHWCNRHITHNRDDEGDYGIRFVIHFAAVFAVALILFYVHPVFFLGWAAWFTAYELNECAKTSDEAWKDLSGSLVGLPAASLVLILMVYHFGLKPWWA